MSAAMVRRGLELLSADHSDGGTGKKKKVESGQKSRRPAVGQSRTKERTGGQRRTTGGQRRTRSALEEYRRKQQRTQTGAALTYFLQSQSHASDQDTTNKIVKQNLGRQSRSRPQRPEKTPPQTQTVFSEEDFQNFQKEYFGDTAE